MLNHDFLHQLLSQPTSPFREGHVIRLLAKILREGGVPFFCDSTGNIIVGAASAADYQKKLARKTNEPVRIFIAHMDHPGFHGAKWLNEKRLQVEWHGGSPTAHLKGASVWLSDRDGWRAEGKLESAKLHKSGRFIESGIVKLSEARPGVPAKDVFGGFSFRAPVWKKGQLIYTKAADDLVGCFAIVSTALELYRRKSPGRDGFVGLLTRAEEVGFIGTIAHLEEGEKRGWWKKALRPLVCVSLETSRALPNAEIGKGPVVRLGDRYTVFDDGKIRLLTDLAESLIPGKYQRRIMDGGTCEATAATVFGIASIGMSIPLGNYHNQSFEGGPDSRGALGPAPEFVHLGDVEGMLKLCLGLCAPGLAWARPWEKKKKELHGLSKKYRPLRVTEP